MAEVERVTYGSLPGKVRITSSVQLQCLNGYPGKAAGVNARTISRAFSSNIHSGPLRLHPNHHLSLLTNVTSSHAFSSSCDISIHLPVMLSFQVRLGCW